WIQTNRDVLTGLEIWPSHLAQESGVYRRRGLNARVGHRREPDDLQLCGYVFPEAHPRARAETVSKIRRPPGWGLCLSEIRAVPRPQQIVSGARGALRHCALESGNGWRCARG